MRDNDKRVIERKGKKSCDRRVWRFLYVDILIGDLNYIMADYLPQEKIVLIHP